MVRGKGYSVLISTKLLTILFVQLYQFVTRPVKTGHVGTNYTKSLYSSYLSAGNIYFHSVTCIMMPIEYLLRAENCNVIA